MMAGIGFSDAVTTQLSLAELHGNLTLSLEKISAYLENMRKVKKKLIEVSTYPLILLGFFSSDYARLAQLLCFLKWMLKILGRN